MFKLLTIVGARPQFIKASVVSQSIGKLKSSKIKEILVHTGQHYDSFMSDIFFKELELTVPKYNLNVGSHLHGKQTALMLEKLEKIFIKERPDLILVYGDTNSTLAGALTGAKLHIPVAHIEAGMRSFNKKMPEEINRIAVDHMSSILFCSSKTAVENLRKEGIQNKYAKDYPFVFYVGDVMLDSLKIFYQISKSKSHILKTLNLKPRNYFLATIHRAENTDDPVKLRTILNSFSEIASQGRTIIMPLHPRTYSALQRMHFKKVSCDFHMIEPVSYLDMLQLEKNAKGIVTDSGGVQKEAYFFSIPCMTLRDQTEWVETLQGGMNDLVPIEKKAIQKHFMRLDQKLSRSCHNEYGCGHAARRIVKAIEYLT